MIEQFNNSTVQQFRNSIFQQFKNSTIQQLNNSTIQQFNHSTIQQKHITNNNNNYDDNNTTTTTTCALCPGKNSHLDGFLPVREALVIFLFCLLCLLLLQIHNLPLGQKSIHPTEPCFFVEFVTNTCGILLLRRVCNKYVQNSLALPSSFAVVLHSLSQVF